MYLENSKCYFRIVLTPSVSINYSDNAFWTMRSDPTLAVIIKIGPLPRPLCEDKSTVDALTENNNVQRAFCRQEMRSQECFLAATFLKLRMGFDTQKMTSGHDVYCTEPQLSLQLLSHILCHVGNPFCFSLKTCFRLHD